MDNSSHTEKGLNLISIGLLINLFDKIKGEESWLGWKRLCVLEGKVRMQGYDVCLKRDKNTNAARLDA